MLFGRYSNHKNFFVRHSLSLVLTLLLLIWSVVYLVLSRKEWVSEQQDHGFSTAWSEFWVFYWSEWMVSTLADIFGALIIVLTTKWFYEQKSTEGKDPEDDVQALAGRHGN